MDVLDTDGDLGGGKVILSIDEDVAQERPMSDVFMSQTPPIELGATEATIELIVRLETVLDAGDELQIGFKLEDGAGQESNAPWVKLAVTEPGG
jgi:hypothetical protein